MAELHLPCQFLEHCTALRIKNGACFAIKGRHTKHRPASLQARFIREGVFFGCLNVITVSTLALGRSQDLGALESILTEKAFSDWEWLVVALSVELGQQASDFGELVEDEHLVFKLSLLVHYSNECLKQAHFLSSVSLARFVFLPATEQTWLGASLLAFSQVEALEF